MVRDSPIGVARLQHIHLNQPKVDCRIVHAAENLYRSPVVRDTWFSLAVCTRGHWGLVIMKKIAMTRLLLLASVSPGALALIGAAGAADLPVKAPRVVAAPAPAYSWTGCYVGAHLGWGWGHQDPSATNSHSAVVSSTTTITNHSGAHGFESNGGLYGGQLGCNYQFASNWVAGVEGSISGADIHGTWSDPFLGAASVRTDWIASAVARLGITAWNNQALFYVKGGAAWDHNRWDLSAAAVPGPSFSENRSGWTVGGGVEWAFMPTWTAFVDFSYYDFGHGSTVAWATPVDVNTFTTGNQHIETVKIGVNYKFTGP